MSSKVTMQDIADALGLSRNTVSKALNSTGVIADNTKELILRKAAEMGYRNLSSSGKTASGYTRIKDYFLQASAGKNKIAMLTCSMPGGSHFAVTTLDRMQQVFSSYGYSLTFFRITPSELTNLRPPANLDLSETAGIFCMELFHYEYCRMLSELGVPMLLIDGPVRTGSDPLPVDLLLMENNAGIYSFVMQLAEKGRKSVGFVGNMRHCRSFFERGSTCLSTATVYGLLPAEQFSLLDYPPGTDNTRSLTYADHSNDLYGFLQSLPALPDAFVCANDFIAINLISSLRRMNLSCPEDILIMGFDDSPESRFHSPSLSTVHIHTQAMGDLAAELLLSRIADPDREPRTTYSYTDLILRESTRLD